MSKKYDLFMVGLTRIDDTLNSVSIAWAKEWVKTNRVFYFDRPYSLKDLKSELSNKNFRERLPALIGGFDSHKELEYNGVPIYRVTPRLGLPVNFLPEGKLYHALNGYNHWVMREAINKTIKKYKVENYLFINSFFPMVTPFIGKGILKKPLASVYQSFDEMSQEAYIARHGIAAEHEAIKGCDFAIGTSTQLCKRHEQETGRKMHLVANAADFELFANAFAKEYPKPEALAPFTKPIIIYTGHYSDLRMDHELVKKLSTAFSEFDIVFVGTFDANDLKKYGINALANVHFIGSKPLEQLPSYLSHAKAAIIPYASNSLTSGIYPLKINEYLAAGIPCVSTNFSEDIASFGEVVYLANTHDEFIQKLKMALEENPETLLKQRMAVAASNSCRMRINQIEQLLEDFLEGKAV